MIKSETKPFRISMHMTRPVMFSPSCPTVEPEPAHLDFHDTSFAYEVGPEPSYQRVAGLYTARTTIEVYGRAYDQYNVLAFVDPVLGVEPLVEKDNSDFPYEVLVPHCDPIASGANLDANMPIRDCRDYSIRVLAFHVSEALLSWRNVTEIFKKQFHAHVRGHPVLDLQSDIWC